MDTQLPLYRLEIAPLVILPLGRSPFFSYTSNEPVALGSLVAISFGHQNTEGIVYRCDVMPGKHPQWMKAFSGVIMSSFLTDGQMKLATFISKEYMTPLGKTLRHFIPKRVTERKKKEDLQHRAKLSILKPRTDEASVLEIFDAASGKNRPIAIDMSQREDPERLFALLAKRTLSIRKQTLILVPEITLIPPIVAGLSRFFPPSDIVAIHSQMSDGSFFGAWERIRSGTASIIIASRQGLFAPFHDLGLIIVSEEQDESYKQWDMSPRYDGRRIAGKVAELYASQLVYASNTLGSETLRSVRDKECLLVSAQQNHLSVTSAMTLVNLKLERFRKNYSPLSIELIDRLRSVISSGHQALLYINRQGLSAFSVCEHCKNILRCKQCDRALIGSKEGYFRCLSCGYKTNIFPSCPQCGHLSFRNVGFGTERIEREVARAFPRARLFRADATTMRKPGMIQTFYDQGSSGKIDIVIGTRMILKNPPLPKLALIAMIDADSLLSFQDFRGDERLFQDLERASMQIAKTGGHIIVQTFHPEATFFQRIASLESGAFMDRVLEDRKSLGYPPYTRLISIVCQGKTPAAVEKTAHAVSAMLSEALPKDPGFRILPAQSLPQEKRKHIERSLILVRIPHDAPLPDILLQIAADRQMDTLIDVDPISFS
jgi:primosomal protein N' (replication factor Y) (superfamily II helicase)